MIIDSCMEVVLVVQATIQGRKRLGREISRVFTWRIEHLDKVRYAPPCLKREARP